MVQYLNIPMELIVWEDAAAHDVDRMPLGDVSKFKIWNNFTVGFVVGDDEKAVTLAAEIDKPLDNNIELCEGIRVIPKSCILTRLKLQ